MVILPAVSSENLSDIINHYLRENTYDDNKMSLPLAKVILLTKDEVDLLEDFVIFYATLFGYENIIIVDNESINKKVLDHYDVISKKGVTIIKETRPFNKATEFMTEHMLKLKNTCEFILPLETDEFIFLPESNKLSKESVHAFLKKVPSDVSVIRYGSFWGSVVDPNDVDYKEEYFYAKPPRQMTKFYDQNWDKIIVRASTFLYMELWCHRAKFSTGRMETSDDIGLLHYHDYGFRKKIERSIPVIKGYNYVDFKQGLESQLVQATENSRNLCGHKLEYYMIYLKRKIIVETFKTHVKRLPTKDEIIYYSSQQNSVDSVLTNKNNLMNTQVKKEKEEERRDTEDYLIYFDIPSIKTHEIKICPQVKTFMFNLPSLQDIIAKYATRNNATGTDKTTSHAYGPLYEKIFEPYRQTATNVCELGVYSGASILSFSEYFVNAKIQGIDITLENVIFGKQDSRIEYFMMDATKPNFEILGNIQYDIILDDASHLPQHQIDSLKAFIPTLKDGGMYVIEDIAGQNESVLKSEFTQIANDNNLTFEWYDLRSVKNQFDDIVAVFYKNKYVPIDKLQISTFDCRFTS